MMKNHLVSFIFLLSFLAANSQIIWQETFTYDNGTQVGDNNNTSNPAPDWTSSCATCVGGDWFEVRSGKMEGLDTNGPAELTTEVIDISAFPLGVEFLVGLEQSSTMEGCFTSSGAGCDYNCVDWIQVSYNLDGAGFVDVVSASGGACGAGYAYAPNSYAALGNFVPYTLIEKGIIGNTLQIRIAVQNWAASEVHRIDNTFVTEPNVLPVDLLTFEGNMKNQFARLAWTVEQEVNMVGYSVQRKLANSTEFEEVGFLKANGNSQYVFEHHLPTNQQAVYQLKMLNMDGSYTFSNSIELGEKAVQELTIFPNPASEQITFGHPLEQIIRIDIYDVTGRTVRSVRVHDNHFSLPLSTLIPSFYHYKVQTTESVGKGTFVKK